MPPFDPSNALTPPLGKKPPSALPLQAWGKSSNSANLPLSYTPSKPYGLTEDIDEVLAMTTTDLYDSMRKVQEEYVSGEFHNPQATYLPFRRYLVDWMSDIGEQLPSTRRRRSTAPPSPELLEVTKLYQSGQTPLSFRDGESEVLDYLHWTLRAVCPLHVVGYYLSKGVTFEEDRWQGRKLIEKIPKYVKKYAEFFCNLTLQEYTFQKYEPSHLASAIIMASRVALNLEPKWRPDLASLTGYEEADIEPCFEHVFSYYEEQFPGHGSRSNSPKNVTDL
ncbi:hypothetical protein TL16_g12471 [Triparma laevis f. inornata]|uniref:Cyclin C-terminal domain-containing protein n=1 Tax=Triparma laevis f. inornata TaxID=1714386 RepID=A0A9W7EV40_9STRA|nr:hypothetical protein TL16_g12471 [Triparma laevis f. inornata]